MKVCKFYLFIFLLMFFPFCVKAASFSISSSSKSVAPNKSFTVKVGGDSIGRVDLSITGGTLSTSNVWVEQNYVSVTVTAGSSGNVVITATPATGFSDPDANLYNPGARKLTVAITDSPSKPSNSGEKKPNDNFLKNLSVSEGELSPSFAAEKLEYSLNLKADVKQLNIKAEPKDAKAKISGIGDVDLKVGENVIKVIVTAQDGSKRTYTINVYVDETPQVYLPYKNEQVGILSKALDNNYFKDFTADTIDIDGKSVASLTNEKLVIICGINENNERNFYLYDLDNNKIINKIVPLEFDDRIIFVVDKNAYEEVLVNEKMINCKKMFNDDNYCLLDVVDNEGNYKEYLYEASEKTIQLYKEVLNSSIDNCIEVKKSNGLVYSLSGIIVVLVGVILVGLLKLRKGK